MRNLVLGILLVGIVCSFTTSGGPLKPYQEKKFTWYGVDFRLAKFIGSEGFNNPESIEKNAMPKWNNIILQESSKYDIKSALKVKEYGYKIDWMIGMNDEVDVASNIQSDSYNLTEDQIKEHVKGYHGAEGEGVGLAFVVESFNKFEQRGHIWVTFFDETTKEIIHAEKVSGAARGLSFANYWCGAIYDVIKQIKSTKQKKWFRKK